MIQGLDSYRFDGMIGSERLLAAQIRAGQVFPKTMLAWLERHPPAPKPVRRRRVEFIPVADIAPPENLGRRVLEHVAKRSGVPVPCIMGGSRDRAYVAARRRVCALLRRLGYSWPKIGRVLRRHHTTVMYYMGRAA